MVGRPEGEGGPRPLMGSPLEAGEGRRPRPFSNGRRVPARSARATALKRRFSAGLRPLHREAKSPPSAALRCAPALAPSEQADQGSGARALRNLITQGVTDATQQLTSTLFSNITSQTSELNN